MAYRCSLPPSLPLPSLPCRPTPSRSLLLYPAVSCHSLLLFTYSLFLYVPRLILPFSVLIPFPGFIFHHIVSFSFPFPSHPFSLSLTYCPFACYSFLASSSPAIPPLSSLIPNSFFLYPFLSNSSPQFRAHPSSSFISLTTRCF